MRPPHPRARLKAIPTSVREVEAAALAEAAFLTLALRGALNVNPAPPGHRRIDAQREVLAVLRRRVTTQRD